jgi:hypothetical protein
VQYQHPINKIDQVVDEKELLGAQESLKEVYVDQLIKTYIVELVNQTRRTWKSTGASPRGSLTLYRAAQASAAIRGRDYVIPDEIKMLASSALAHRMIVSPAARIKDVSSDAVLADILASVPVPGARVVPLSPGHARRARTVRRLRVMVLLFVFSLGSGLFTGRSLFYHLAYLFAALILLAFLWAWTGISWVHLRRQTRARRAQVGRPLEERFSVRNSSPLPKLWLEVRDHRPAWASGHRS